MRKTLTFLSAAALTLSAVASPVVTRVAKTENLTLSGMRQSMQPSKLPSSQRSSVRGGVVNGTAVLGGSVASLQNLNLRPRKAPARAEAQVPEVITEKPEGNDAMYVRSGDGLTNFLGFIVSSSQNGFVLETVTSQDGKSMYLKNFVTAVPTDTWVKADVTETGFTVPTGQYVFYSEEEGYGVTVGVGKLTEMEEEGEKYLTYVLDENDKEIEFTRNADGSYSIESPLMSEDENPERVVSLFYSDNNEWTAYSDWNTRYTPFNETAALMPDGAEAEDWVVVQNSIFYDTTEKRLVSCAVKDGKFYVAGFNREAPESVVVGTVADGKVTFPSNQYLGVCSGAVSYFVGATFTANTYYDEYFGEDVTEVEYAGADNIVFTYDAEKKTLTPGEKTAILLNAGEVSEPEDVYYIECYDNPELYLFKEVAAVPAEPEIFNFVDYFEDYGFYGIQYFMNPEDAEGKFVDPGKLYYVIWTRVEDDEQKYTFYADDYPGLASLGVDELVEVPYGFSSAGATEDLEYAIDGEYNIIYFFESAPDAVGIQSVYYGGGVRNESPVSWYETSAVGNVSAEGTAPVAVYGIDGMSRTAVGRGINIVKMSDGSVRKVMIK